MSTSRDRTKLNKQKPLLMISIFRRFILSPSLSLPPLHSAALMDSRANHSSQRLLALAQQLRLYRPTPSSDESEEAAGKVVSQVGIPESQTPIAKDTESFRPRRAAVLICLFEGDGGELRVILTKRSSRLSTHSGEVSLPGGKSEPGDRDDAETATREAKEEIGLDPLLVNVVTVMEPFLSKYLLRVVPVIGILTDRKAFNPSPNPSEVETVFDAPLEMFLKDENHWSEQREWMGVNYLMHFFSYGTKDDKYLIWGLTAWILIKAAMLVFERSPDFPERIPKFQYPRVAANDTTLP